MLLQIEKVLKALFVRKLYNWPRFQTQVQEQLDRTPIHVSCTAFCTLLHAESLRKAITPLWHA
jgi:hypothetical protein